MAPLVALDRASLTLGIQRLLDAVSVGISAGERIGVVGRNGGGKSTLLRAFAGAQSVDSGRVVRSRGVRVAMLIQSDEMPAGAVVRDIVLNGLAEHEWAGDARIREIIVGLLGDLDATEFGGWDGPTASLSGGEKRRLSLAGVLIEDPDLLLLDEPTNHLDIEGVAWLAAYLADRRPRSGGADKALVVVTHDRWFLDAISTRTWEVTDAQVHTYDGGYAAYVLARAERDRVAAVTEERRVNLVRKELAWLRRGPPARTSKPKFRIDAAEDLIAAEPPPRNEVELVRFATTRLGKDVFDLINATVQLGDRSILDGVTWRIGPGDRYGVVGVNGAGKSTLFSALRGLVELETGKLKTGKTVQIACLSQDLSELQQVAGMSVIDAITSVRSFTMIGGKEVSASQLATRLGFSGGRQQSRISDLSGGERRRLQFVRLLMDEPNVVMLDEPTNDLDIETLTAMEDVLDGWAGTLLVISHDRYLLERMTDRQMAMVGDGSLRDLPGGVEQYLQLRRGMSSSSPSSGSGSRKILPSGSGSSKISPSGSRSSKISPSGSGSHGSSSSVSPTSAQSSWFSSSVDSSRERSSTFSSSSAQARDARKAVERLERQLGTLTRREGVLHDKMIAAATDAQAMMQLSAELSVLHTEKEDLETRWLEAADLADG